MSIYNRFYIDRDLLTSRPFFQASHGFIYQQAFVMYIYINNIDYLIGTPMYKGLLKFDQKSFLVVEMM